MLSMGSPMKCRMLKALYFQLKGGICMLPIRRRTGISQPTISFEISSFVYQVKPPHLVRHDSSLRDSGLLGSREAGTL